MSWEHLVTYCVSWMRCVVMIVKTDLLSVSWIHSFVPVLFYLTCCVGHECAVLWQLLKLTCFLCREYTVLYLCCFFLTCCVGHECAVLWRLLKLTCFLCREYTALCLYSYQLTCSEHTALFCIIMNWPAMRVINTLCRDFFLFFFYEVTCFFCHYDVSVSSCTDLLCWS